MRTNLTRAVASLVVAAALAAVAASAAAQDASSSTAGQPAAAPSTAPAVAPSAGQAAAGSAEKPAMPAKETPPALVQFGGVRLSRAEAAESIALVRSILKTLEEDKSLRQAPTRQALVATVAARLKEKWPLAEPASNLMAERRHMQVFVTLYAPGGADIVAEGRGTSLAAALVDASCGLWRSARFVAEGFQHLAQTRVELDVTVASRPYVANIAEPFLYSLQVGLEGLVYENGDQRAVVLPWEALRRPWEMRFIRKGRTDETELRAARTPEDLKQTIFKALLERAGTDANSWRTPLAFLMRFTTQIFVEPRAGGGGGDPIELLRTGTPLEADLVTADDVTRAARLAADHLARVPDPSDVAREGFDPLRRQWTGEFETGRQALVVQALVRLHRAEKQPWMERAALGLGDKLAAELKLVKVKRRDGSERRCLFAVSGPKSELVSTAQAVGALADLLALRNNRETRERITLLANTLLVSQKEDGSFGAYFTPATAAGAVGKNEEDVSGEAAALLGLVRAHEAVGGDELLKAARSSAEYMVFAREKKMNRATPSGLVDPYLIEALAALDRQLVNDEFVRYAARCADAIIERQATDASRYLPDELGGFLSDTSLTAEQATFCLRGLRTMDSWASRLESQSPERYKKLDLAVSRDRWSKALRCAEAFLLGLQYTDRNSFYMADGPLAIGGLRQSTCDSRISTVAMANFLLAETK